jgi:uncharacterized membrane protein
MLQELKSIFNQLSTLEKSIFIFWGLCFTLFVFAYFRAVIELIKMRFTKNKPQTF